MQMMCSKIITISAQLELNLAKLFIYIDLVQKTNLISSICRIYEKENKVVIGSIGFSLQQNAATDSIETVLVNQMFHQ